MRKKLLQIFSQSKSTLALILIGTIVWSLTMVKSGFPRSYGLGFWGPNGHDGIWHIALAESLAQGSFQIPIFSGAQLQNYHVGFDFLLALIHRLTQIPISNLYFQILPPIFAFLIGLLSYWFVLSWTKSQKSAKWAVFFVYFGGSFGWIVNLLRGEEVGGESMFWSQQSVSTLINPPFALSLVFILLGLIILINKVKKPLHYLLCALCFGLLIQIKAYAGVLVLGSLLISGIWMLLKEKKSDILLLFLASSFVSLVIFLPFNKNPQGLLVYQPFWFLETMMGFEDRFGWQKFYSAMTNYRLGGVWLKAILAYLTAFLIFWYGNIGTRLLKELLVIKWLRNIKTITWIEIFIASVVVFGGLIPMFFLQKGTPWNTIQFLYYSLFFSGILAAVAIPELERMFNGRTLNAIKIALVVLTIPTTIGTMKHYLPGRPPAMLSNDEEEALKFLSRQPNGVVLTYPFDKEKAKAAESSPPRPLYIYESTAYVSAFSKKPTFLEDEINLDITGYDWKERRKETEEFFVSGDETKIKNFLEQNQISYIYLIKGQRVNFDESISGIRKIFENSQTNIFKVE